MTERCVEFSINDGLAKISMARPETGNAIDRRLCRQLRDAAEACAADRKVRAVLLSGHGKNFCVGGDLKEFEAAGESRPQLIASLADDLHAAEQALRDMDAPVICAAQGAAAGAGFSLAIGADLLVASRSATFTSAYTRIGLSPDGGSTHVLPRLVGLRRAQELIFTNRTLSADEALVWGLVTAVYDDADFRERVEALARQMVDGAIGALGAAKRLLARTYGREFRDQVAEEGALISRLSGEPDAEEGIAAFRAKRPPRFLRD